MVLKYGFDIDLTVVNYNIGKITNQIFKLLPMREEQLNWKVPLENLIFELKGLNSLMKKHTNFLPLLSKMESLLLLENDTEENFLLFRKNIFECLTLLDKIKKDLNREV